MQRISLVQPGGHVGSQPRPLNRNLFEEFRALANEFERAIGETGSAAELRIDFDNFRRLDVSRQHKAIENLARFHEPLRGSISVLGEHPGHFYLRSALRKFGWKLKPDVFEKLCASDVVEIWGADCTLKMANIRFLQVCSYSLEHALAHEFWELFERDPSITDGLIKIHGSVMRGETGAVERPFRAHYVSEIESRERRRFFVTPGLVAPVFDAKSGRREAVLTSFDVKVL